MDSRSDLTLHGVCLVVAYDGTDFAGSQVQPAARTVQGELERAIAVMTGHPGRARFCGRTDAGVHALAQVVAFDSARAIPPMNFLKGLNSKLPDDLRVQRAVACPVGYEPRFEALEKTYRYVVQVGPTKNPLLRHRTYQIRKAWTLDLGRMHEAASILSGTHDYRAFRAADDQRDNATRTIHAITIEEHHAGDPTLLAIDVRGTAFMKNMVRIIAGTLLDIGRGRIPLSRVPAMLGAQAQRDDAGHTAPPEGLTLMNVVLGRRLPSPLAGL